MKERKGAKGEGKVFADTDEARIAYAAGVLDEQAGVGGRKPLVDPVGNHGDAFARYLEQFDELLGLENAQKSGEIGPKTYERERARIVDELADVV